MGVLSTKSRPPSRAYSWPQKSWVGMPRDSPSRTKPAASSTGTPLSASPAARTSRDCAARGLRGRRRGACAPWLAAEDAAPSTESALLRFCSRGRSCHFPDIDRVGGTGPCRVWGNDRRGSGRSHHLGIRTGCSLSHREAVLTAAWPPTALSLGALMERQCSATSTVSIRFVT